MPTNYGADVEGVPLQQRPIFSVPGPSGYPVVPPPVAGVPVGATLLSPTCVSGLESCFATLPGLSALLDPASPQILAHPLTLQDRVNPGVTFKTVGNTDPVINLSDPALGGRPSMTMDSGSSSFIQGGITLLATGSSRIGTVTPGNPCGSFTWIGAVSRLSAAGGGPSGDLFFYLNGSYMLGGVSGANAFIHFPVFAPQVAWTVPTANMPLKVAVALSWDAPNNFAELWVAGSGGPSSGSLSAQLVASATIAGGLNVPDGNLCFWQYAGTTMMFGPIGGSAVCNGVALGKRVGGGTTGARLYGDALPNCLNALKTYYGW